MTSQGHTYAQFQRALETGNAFLAMQAARELTTVTLEDALSLCLLLRHEQRYYQRAAARWLVRFHAEVEGVTLGEIREIADLMAALPLYDTDAGAQLAAVFERRRLHRCAERVRQAVTKPPEQSTG